MDLTKYRQKLIGNEDERAVSPVIGVVLMISVVVILSAVIAAFVMDIGDGMGGTQDATSGVSMEFDKNAGDSGEMSISLTSEGNAADWEIRGDVEDVEDVDGAVDYDSAIDQAGATATLECGTELADGETGTVTVVASMSGSDSYTTVGTHDFDCGTDE